MTSGSHNTHSRLAPSAAKRWSTCTASVAYIAELKDQGKIPEESTSVYAEEGTIAHDLAAAILTKEDVSFEDIPDPEMRQAVKSYVKLAEGLKQDGDEVFIEESVPLFYAPDDKGTVDFALVNDDRVYVLDLKYGAGVMVDAKDNPQLAIYALSLIEQMDGIFAFHDQTLVTMAIHQPRTMEGMPTKLWSIRLDDLREWVKPLEYAVAVISEPRAAEPAFAPSEDACQWCPAKGLCKARADQQTNTFSEEGIEAVKDFVDLNEDRKNKITETLSDAQIAHIVTNGGDLIKWVNSVQADALERIQSGVKVEGLKLIAGKPGNRAWGDEEAAQKLIQPKLGAANIWNKKLLSVSQAEKALKDEKLSTRFENRFKELVTRAEGKPKLAPADDPAPDISISAESEFTNEEEPDLLA